MIYNYSNIQQLLRRYKIYNILDKLCSGYEVDSEISYKEKLLCEYIFNCFDIVKIEDDGTYYNNKSLPVFQHCNTHIYTNIDIWYTFENVYDIKRYHISSVFRGILEYVCDIKFGEEYIWRKSFKKFNEI